MPLDNVSNRALGAGSTVTLNVCARDVHPLASVIVTVYEVLDVGLTNTELPDCGPGTQLNVYTGVPPIPVAVNKVESPAQALSLPASESNRGAGSVSVTVEVPVHPFASVISTV